MLHLPIGSWIKGANDSLLDTPLFAVCLKVLLKLGSLVCAYSRGHAISANNFLMQELGCIQRVQLDRLRLNPFTENANGYNDGIQPIPGHRA